MQLSFLMKQLFLKNMDKEENGEVSEDTAENLQKAALNGHSQQTASQKSGKKSKPWKKKKLSGPLETVLPFTVTFPTWKK